MALIALQHIGQHGTRHEHRSDGVDVDSSYDLLLCYLIEGLVAGDDTRTVDKNINVTTILANLLIDRCNHLIVGNIGDIALHLAKRLELLNGAVDVCLVNIPDDYTVSTLLKRHSTHYLSNTRSSSCNKDICTF